MSSLDVKRLLTSSSMSTISSPFAPFRLRFDQSVSNAFSIALAAGFSELRRSMNGGQWSLFITIDLSVDTPGIDGPPVPASTIPKGWERGVSAAAGAPLRYSVCCSLALTDIKAYRMLFPPRGVMSQGFRAVLASRRVPHCKHSCPAAYCLLGPPQHCKR